MITFAASSELTNKKRRIAQVNDTLNSYDLHGFSSENDYIPFNSIWINSGIYDKKIIHYSIFDTSSSYLIKNYNSLYNAMDSATISRIFQTSSMPKPLHVLKGMLYEVKDNKPIVHFVLAIKKDYIFTMDRSHIDITKFAIFLSVDFVNGKTDFDNVYKKLSKDKIKPSQELGIPTIIVSDISKWCYKNSLENLNFDTVSQRQRYLQGFNKKVFI